MQPLLGSTRGFSWREKQKKNKNKVPQAGTPASIEISAGNNTGWPQRKRALALWLLLQRSPARFLVQAPLGALRARSRRSQEVVLGVGCLVAARSTCCGARRSLAPSAGCLGCELCRGESCWQWGAAADAGCSFTLRPAAALRGPPAVPSPAGSGGCPALGVAAAGLWHLLG